jgi:hypothetical protein
MKGEVSVLGYLHGQHQQAQTWDHSHQPTPNYPMLSRIDSQAHVHPSNNMVINAVKLHTSPRAHTNAYVAKNIPLKWLHIWLIGAPVYMAYESDRFHQKLHFQ